MNFLPCGRHVPHVRFAPRRHRFLYRISLFAIDLDERATLHRRLALFAVNRANRHRFRDQDYLPAGKRLHHSLLTGKRHPMGDATALFEQRVVTHFADRGIDRTGGRVLRVTLPRG